MLYVVLAGIAAACYGAADFLAGLGARRAPVIRVTLVIYAAGTAGMLLALLPAAPPGRPSPGSLIWGAVAGVGLGGEALLLNAAFSRADFSIAAPLSATVGTVLAVAAGLILGERPGPWAWAGIILAIPAILAVTIQGCRGSRAGVSLGLAAGIGYALSLIGLSRSGPAAGLYPVLASEAAALATVAAVAMVTGDLPIAGKSHAPRLSGTPAWRLSITSGLLGAAAAVCYVYAARGGQVAVAAVVVSLFPAVTVALAAVIGERLNAARVAGLVCAAASVALMCAGVQLT
jgi:drug/metabolite transporter (DMT)-like permease